MTGRWRIMMTVIPVRAVRISGYLPASVQVNLSRCRVLWEGGSGQMGRLVALIVLPDVRVARYLGHGYTSSRVNLTALPEN